LSAGTAHSLAAGTGDSFIKRLLRNATETPLAQGLALERNLFLKKITSPSRSFEV
jgi:hypothetical protein